MFAQALLEVPISHLLYQMQPQAPVRNSEEVVMEAEQQLVAEGLTDQVVIQRSFSQAKHRPAQHNREYQQRARNLQWLSQVMAAIRSVLCSTLLCKRW
jgi:hypothetical protein